MVNVFGTTWRASIMPSKLNADSHTVFSALRVVLKVITSPVKECSSCSKLEIAYVHCLPFSQALMIAELVSSFDWIPGQHKGTAKTSSYRSLHLEQRVIKADKVKKSSAVRRCSLFYVQISGVVHLKEYQRRMLPQALCGSSTDG